MKMTAAGAMIIPMLLLVGCGDTDVEPAGDDDSAEVAEQSRSDSAPSDSASSEPDLPSDETLERYFQGIASRTIPSLQESIDLAVPGSPAAAYATYLQASEQARIDGGTSEGEVMETTVRKVEGGYEYCGQFGADQECYTNTDIKGAGGQVANFSVNGKPLKGRLVLGDGNAVPVAGLDANVELIAAFESSTGAGLFVVVSVKTGKSATVAGIEATYRSVDGRQSTANDRQGPNELAPDSLANYSFLFPSATVGGAITLHMYDETFVNEGTVSLKTR